MLCNMMIPLYQQKVLQLQWSYTGSSLKVSPTQLITMADEECPILKQAFETMGQNYWPLHCSYESATSDIDSTNQLSIWNTHRKFDEAK